MLDEATAWSVFEQARWSGHPQLCPHCGAAGRCYFLQPRDGVRRTRAGHPTSRRIWKCGACRRQFSVLTGTVLEGTRIPLVQWLDALVRICNGIEPMGPAGLYLPATRRHIEFVLTTALGLSP